MDYDNWLDKQYHDWHDEDTRGMWVEYNDETDEYEVWSRARLEADGFDTAQDAWDYVGGE